MRGRALVFDDESAASTSSGASSRAVRSVSVGVGFLESF